MAINSYSRCKLSSCNTNLGQVERAFYGINPYISGGILFQPFAGLTASLAKPIGSGTNSFNTDLAFSRVPIYSAGINWNQSADRFSGLITNGFGTASHLNTCCHLTTALVILQTSCTHLILQTHPKFLTPRQQTRKGGLTVNTALVPRHDHSGLINTDDGKNFNRFFGYSISNVAQLNIFSSGTNNNVPQTTNHARFYANDDTWNWRIGGKAVAFSPLRGAPFWGGGHISLGRNIDVANNRIPGYLFAETMGTFELNSKLAININPKSAWSRAGN